MLTPLTQIFSLLLHSWRILQTQSGGYSRHMGALLSCKLNQCDMMQWYPHKMVAVTSSIKLRTITDCTNLHFYPTKKRNKRQSKNYTISSRDVVVSSPFWQQAGAFVCVGGCTRYMCHLITMVDLLSLPGVWYVRASFKSDKRHQERGVWAPGEHRRHWRCWASDREAEIQGWFKRMSQCLCWPRILVSGMWVQLLKNKINEQTAARTRLKMCALLHEHKAWKCALLNAYIMHKHVIFKKSLVQSLFSLGHSNLSNHMLELYIITVIPGLNGVNQLEQKCS